MNKNILLECRGLKKSYAEARGVSVDVLKGIDFSVKSGECIAIIGPSGSGKSTLLHLLGGLDKPSAGCVLQNGLDWQTLSEKKRCQLRNKALGFVYQFHHLLPEFSALENVALPLLLAGKSVDASQAAAEARLIDVGLSARIHHKPSELSGGERQRVAIARALVHQPNLVFADEPTGNLDRTTALQVFEGMLDLNKKCNTALVIVTHDEQLAARMDRILVLQDGYLK